MKTKERILVISTDLFNSFGATEVTTNDIAKELKMSPGNLYFHYKNKEQIIREIFKRMINETKKLWKPQTQQAKKSKKFQLVDFLDNNLALYWKYRFFHREMYILRKKDPDLSKLWRAHMKKMSLINSILYKHWVKSGYMNDNHTKAEMEYLGELLFIAANSFMQFLGTSDNLQVLQPKTYEKARRHIMRMLLPFLSHEAKKEFQFYLQP